MVQKFSSRSTVLMSSAAAGLLLSTIFLTITIKSVESQQQLPIPSTIQSMPCSTNQDCARFPNTECRRLGGYCECQKDHVEFEGKCYPRGSDLTSECENDVQCTLSSLGALSRCSPDSKKCECYDTRSGGRNSTAFYASTCYIRLVLGQRCDIAEQCKASISPAEDVTCEIRTRTCQCQEGKVCENVKGGAADFKTRGTFFTSVTFLLVGFLAVKVLN